MSTKIEEWKNVGMWTIPASTTGEDVLTALHDLLVDFGQHNRDSVDFACELLGHPEGDFGKCYCGAKSYGNGVHRNGE